MPLEKEAARLAFDEEYPQDEVQHKGVFYLGGRIGAHKIVLGVQRRIGLSQAAIIAKMSSPGMSVDLTDSSSSCATTLFSARRAVGGAWTRSVRTFNDVAR